MARVIFISNPYENLGIEYMSAVLESAGHEVGLIIDPCLFFNAYQRNNLLGKIFNYKTYVLGKIIKMQPDLVCLSVMTDNYQWALDLAKKIKEKINTWIVFGGIHPTILPELVINESCVDFVCVGEGEEALVELADNIHDPDKLLHIKNIFAKREGQIFKNTIRPLIKELDKLPFPCKELYYRESRMYSKEYFIITSRGCNYSCAFCCNQVLLNLYGKSFSRRRTVRNVIKELYDNKKKYNFRFVWFMDDNFVLNSEWIKEFSREYSRYIGVPFFCYSHPNNLSGETAELLKKANCREMGIGVESLNENTCKLINRITEKSLIDRSLKILKNNKIVSIAENILGLPGEKEKDILDLVGFYNKNRPDLILFSWLKVFPGTEMLRILKARGLISQTALQNLISGKDNSLALGGNYASVSEFRRSACLLVLLPFLNKKVVSFLAKVNIFKCPVIVNPNFILRIIRAYKSSFFSVMFMGNKTYDAGLKISLRIYKHYIIKKFRLVLNLGE
ncbi:MAG: radical SAM protein [Candidatus Omnitrophota bacterium]